MTWLSNAVDNFRNTIIGKDKDEPVGGGRALQRHLAPIIIIAVGGLMVLASMFMPALSSPQLLLGISGNLVIQSDPVLLVGAVAAVVAAVRYWNSGSVASANLAIYAGFWFLGWTVFDASTSQLVNGLGANVETDAGAGLWTTGVGCLLIAFSGLMMRFPQFGFGLVTGPVAPRDEVSAALPTKTCPKCAETVKAAATICRFCQHEFGQTASASGAI
jgi:hypothetical protein